MKGFKPVGDREYRGRHITVGRMRENSPADFYIAYMFEGRSEGSRARYFNQDEQGVIWTEAKGDYDFNKGNPTLELYPAVAREGHTFIATNGFQTNAVLTAIRNQGHDIDSNPKSILKDAFRNPFFVYDKRFGMVDVTTYEPDSLSTPRISAVVQPGEFALYIVKKDSTGPAVSETFYYHLNDLAPGQGRFISTYNGPWSGPAFEGNPLVVSIDSVTAQDIAEEIWGQLVPRPGIEEVRGGLAVVTFNSNKNMIDVAIMPDLEKKVEE